MESCPVHSIYSLQKEVITDVNTRGVKIEWKFNLFFKRVGVTLCIPMGHGTGLRSGAHRGTVRFALARSGPHREWCTVAHFQTDSVLLRFTLGAIKRPLWHGTVWVQHRLKTLFNNVSLLKIWAACPYMLSVSLIKCKHEALKKKKAPQKPHYKCFKKWK